MQVRFALDERLAWQLDGAARAAGLPAGLEGRAAFVRRPVLDALRSEQCRLPVATLPPALHAAAWSLRPLRGAGRRPVEPARVMKQAAR